MLEVGRGESGLHFDGVVNHQEGGFCLRVFYSFHYLLQFIGGSVVEEELNGAKWVLSYLLIGVMNWK